MTLPPTSKEASHSIGELCIDGDWACSHGDFDGLRDIAQQLAACVAEPLHCELVELAGACQSDPARATALWARLKDTLYRTARA
jgi:hypothetical protein